MTVEELGEELETEPDSEFARTGYRLFPLTVDLGGFFSPDYARPFDVDDHAPGYSYIPLIPDTVRSLNESHEYFRAPLRRDRKRLCRYLWSIAPDIEAELGMPWAVSNVRAWRTRRGGTSGPLGFHQDGDSGYVRKLMLYPQAMNLANGTLEITRRDTKTLVLETDGPTAVLYDSAGLKHRGVAPEVAEWRPIIEVTIVPARRTRITYIYAGQNARVPEHVW